MLKGKIIRMVLATIKNPGHIKEQVQKKEAMAPND